MGNPTGFCLTPGQASDRDGADVLIPRLQAEALLADKTDDADEWVLDKLKAPGITPVLPPKANRKEHRAYDADIYKARHLVENFFAKLKQARAIATRYDKTDRNFLAAVYSVASIILLN